MWLVPCSFLLVFSSLFKSCDMDVLFSGYNLEPCSVLVLRVWLQKACPQCLKFGLNLVPVLLYSFCNIARDHFFYVVMFFCPSTNLCHPCFMLLKLCVNACFSDDWPQGAGGEQWRWKHILWVKVWSWCARGNSKHHGEAEVYGWKKGIFSCGAFQ